jgi:O-antigen ligase
LPAHTDVRPGAASARVIAGAAPRFPVACADRLAPGKGEQAKKRLPWPVVLLLVGLFIPWIIPLGPLNMSVNRIVLVTMLVPCLIMWARGKAGPIRTPDIGLLLYCGWAAVSLVVAHGGTHAIEPSGMLFIETIGAYLMARCYIRDAEDFEKMVTLVAKLIAVLFPFALYESLTGSKPILSAFGAVLPTVEVTLQQPRFGLWRVQGPFDHSIAFGLVCGSVFVLSCLVTRIGRKAASRGLVAATVSGTALLSMSSAPIAGLVVQGALMSWNWLLRGYRSRWKILWALVFVGYLVVEFGSNQTPVQFYISHFTFDQQTGWVRLAIWEFGSASVLNHPFFGIGFGDWIRPKWMPDSIDNFWLVIAVRHGIPACGLMLASCLWVMFAVAAKEKLDEGLQEYRAAYLICTTTCLLVGATVHFWGTPYTWFLFLLGSGVWLLDVNTGKDNIGTVRMSRPKGADRSRLSPCTRRRL